MYRGQMLGSPLLDLHAIKRILGGFSGVSGYRKSSGTRSRWNKTEHPDAKEVRRTVLIRKMPKIACM